MQAANRVQLEAVTGGPSVLATVLTPSFDLPLNGSSPMCEASGGV